MASVFNQVETIRASTADDLQLLLNAWMDAADGVTADIIDVKYILDTQTSGENYIAIIHYLTLP
jgi:hypothetical protein